ncbi:MAG: hypothetical protein IKD80_03485 [Selenomonadaceae bacterium]|nr:hypothetical protein [Selenomonadaceae bacterium]
MKKILGLLAGVVLIGACAFALSDNTASAYVQRSPGTYQCAICGVIAQVVNPGTVLDETDDFYDGHTHDWRYIGGLSGTIHPIK